MAAAARCFLFRKKNMAAIARSPKTMIGMASPIPIFAPVDIPLLPAALWLPAVAVAEGVGDVIPAPTCAVVVVVAVFCAIKLTTSLSLSCHCTWITSAMMVPTPPLASKVVNEAPLGIGSSPRVEVKYTLARVFVKMLAHTNPRCAERK